MFAANIRAKNDIWFIGDHMIREACPFLQELQKDQDSGYDNYLHSNYDTYVFYPNFTESNVLTMVRNGFVEALNKRIKMPSAVVILVSDQLIVEDPLYLPSEIDRKIKWILREIDAAVKIRKSTLPVKAYTMGEPRIMWVRAFQNTKANNVPPEMMLKFNNMLRKICMAKAVYMIPVNAYHQSTARCYDYDGKTKIKQGFDLLWIDIINGIQQHDRNDKIAEQERIIKDFQSNASYHNHLGSRNHEHQSLDTGRNHSKMESHRRRRSCSPIKRTERNRHHERDERHSHRSCSSSRRH